jgi:hypothetical protein
MLKEERGSQVKKSIGNLCKNSLLTLVITNTGANFKEAFREVLIILI